MIMIKSPLTAAPLMKKFNLSKTLESRVDRPDREDSPSGAA